MPVHTTRGPTIKGMTRSRGSKTTKSKGMRTNFKKQAGQTVRGRNKQKNRK